jgi:hypothetical protein
MVLKAKSGDGHSRMPTGVYRMSEKECTHFKHIYWENKYSQRVRLSPHDSQSFTYGTCSIRRTWMCACVFQGIWTPDGHSASNKGSSDRNAVKRRKVGWGKFWVAVSYGKNCTLLALFIFLTKMFETCALFLRHPVHLHEILIRDTKYTRKC